MKQEELFRYAGHRTGNICVDLRFDVDSHTPRATIIFFRKGQWSVGLRYLLHESRIDLDDSQFTQAFLTGDYESFEMMVEHLEVFLGRQFDTWINHTRLGFLLELLPDEQASYDNIDWLNWRPQRLVVPSGTTFQIMRPENWENQTILVPAGL